MSKNQISVVNNAGLEKPGDNLSARITDTNREVLKIEKNGGADKYSATRYPNGTVVETHSKKAR